MINIQKICDEKKIARYFSAIIAGDSLPPKPDPTVFREAAKRMGKLPMDCLVIEDSRVGIRAAKAAGMRCVAVATTNPASQLTEADIIIPDLTKLDDGFIGKEILGKN
jgi:beta-phosphoglucomutase-like phosphatase (HAD superfamily)